MSRIKKVYLWMLILIVGGGMATYAAVPTFDEDFAKYMTSTTPDSQGRIETVFSLCIDKNLSLMENVKNLFYPSTTPNSSSPCGGQPGGQLWGVVQTLGIVILFVFLVLAGVKFIMEAKSSDGPKKAASSLFYIAYGAFLVFGVIRILGTVLNLPNVQGTTQLVNAVQNGLFLQILSFFKVLAFFLAIIMMVVTGIKMMSSMDKEDKIKSARTGILNIIIALVFIKLIDYIFYIAQVPTFAVQAKEMIVNIAIVLWYISGAAFVAAIFYAGFLFMTAGGKEDSLKKAKWMITNIVIASVVIFMFLLIVFQIFNEFA